jgi:NAD(P)-dependent dehydrogenase (short-subunit alcohol dehydrogenase family)
VNGFQLRAKMQGSQTVWGTMLVYARALAAAIAFLASDDASYVIATVLHVDGGSLTAG